MKMVGEDGEAKQIDAKAGSQVLQTIFEPSFAMIEVLSGDGIVSQEEATSDASIHDMQGSDLGRIEDLSASDTGHEQNPR
jgi:hypothetical protein